MPAFLRMARDLASSLHEKTIGQPPIPVQKNTDAKIGRTPTIGDEPSGYNELDKNRCQLTVIRMAPE
jgi:hypothetical protein